MSDHVTWLTEAAHNRLTQELEERQGPIREEITKRIALAREEQGKNEGRIAHLLQLLEHARVGTPEVPDGEAHIGRLVTVEFAPDEQESYYIGSPEERGSSEHEVLSPTSPLGAALVGHRIGDEVSYKLPNGREITVVLVDVQSH